jgi:hypothetical protein
MRIITIRLRDFVDETKRRERRGGGVIVAIIGLTIAAIVARPAEKKSVPVPVVTQTIPPATITAVPVTQTAIATSTSAPLPVPSSPPPPPPPVPARAVAAPQTLRFDPLMAGGSSPVQLVNVRNAGEQPLAIRQVTSSGAAFRITNGCSGGALERGASCSVAVVFSPPGAGEHTGRLTVATSAGPINIPLRGVARAVPPVELAPLDFGRQQIGQKIAPQRVRFVNSGSSPLSIGDVTLTGQSFSIASNRCEGAVPPGGECDVLIAFIPRDGQAEGEIKLASEGHLVAHASISGAGFASRPPVHLDIKPRELHFLFGVTPPQRITITNPSAEAIKIYSVRVVGGGRSFKVSAEKCVGMTLQPHGGSCMVVVGAAAGFRAESFQIIIDHSGSDQPESIGASAAPR